jgi:hypothetical protein
MKDGTRDPFPDVRCQCPSGSADPITRLGMIVTPGRVIFDSFGCHERPTQCRASRGLADLDSIRNNPANNANGIHTNISDALFL